MDDHDDHNKNDDFLTIMICEGVVLAKCLSPVRRCFKWPGQSHLQQLATLYGRQRMSSLLGCFYRYIQNHMYKYSCNLQSFFLPSEIQVPHSMSSECFLHVLNMLSDCSTDDSGRRTSLRSTCATFKTLREDLQSGRLNWPARSWFNAPEMLLHCRD